LGIHQWGICQSSGEFVVFYCADGGGAVVLDWATSAEGDCNFFSLQRSTDGVNYVELAEIAAAGGADRGHQYYFSDNAPGSDKNFYRLKMVGRSGAASYSSVVMAKFAGGDNGLVFSPNPSDGKSISVRAIVPVGAPYTVDVYNSLGMLVRHVTALTPSPPLTFSPTLLPGVYVARVSAQGYAAVGAFLVRQ